MNNIGNNSKVFFVLIVLIASMLTSGQSLAVQKKSEQSMRFVKPSLVFAGGFGATGWYFGSRLRTLIRWPIHPFVSMAGPARRLFTCMTGSLVLSGACATRFTRSRQAIIKKELSNPTV